VSRQPTPAEKFDLAIFDHDGVLVDSLPFHEESWLVLGRREGLPFTKEFVHATFGMTNPMIFERLLGPGIPPEQVARYGDIKEACYRDLVRGHLVLMPGVRDLLDGLTAAGVKLAIGSSGPRENLILTVRECGLDSRFSAIVALEDITRGKPDPQVFLLAAQRAGCDPARTVVFEDAPVGIQAAKAAGMTAIGVGTTHPLESLTAAGADRVVQTLEGFALDDL
jgi:HAD superfamily hydrolase (TIGR01509 family)